MTAAALWFAERRQSVPESQRADGPPTALLLDWLLARCPRLAAPLRGELQVSGVSHQRRSWTPAGSRRAARREAETTARVVSGGDAHPPRRHDRRVVIQRRGRARVSPRRERRAQCRFGKVRLVRMALRPGGPRRRWRPKGSSAVRRGAGSGSRRSHRSASGRHQRRRGVLRVTRAEHRQAAPGGRAPSASVQGRGAWEMSRLAARPSAGTSISTARRRGRATTPRAMQSSGAG